MLQTEGLPADELGTGKVKENSLRRFFRRSTRTTDALRAAPVRLSEVTPTNPAEEMALQTLLSLRARFCRLEGGLSDRELSLAEERVGCTFPPDLAALLQIAVPVAENFPSWRDLRNPSLQRQLERPTEGVVFDVLHNQFWHPDWPDRPGNYADAEAAARASLATVAPLIPILGHQYMPSQPTEVGNPILSVCQTDVFIRGIDLAVWGAGDGGLDGTEFKTGIPFWGYWLA